MSLLKRIEQGQGNQPGQPQGSGATETETRSRLMSLQARRVAPPGGATQKDTYYDLKTRVQNRLLAELDPSMDVTKTNEVRNTILELFEQVLAEENIVQPTANICGRTRLVWARSNRFWKTIRSQK